MSENQPPSAPVRPVGFNHLVLHVRDLEESHDFWSGLLGFQQVGELYKSETRPNPAKMRFYSGVTNNVVNHHDLALLEVPDLPMAPEWAMAGSFCAFNHLAITYPDRESWMAQVQFLNSKDGLENPLRMDHGMTHSLYITDPNGYRVELLYDLPEEVWSGDINEALQYAVALPDEDILSDSTDYKVF